MKQVVSIRADPADLKILEKNDIKLNGDFVHQCVNFLTEPKTLEVHTEDPFPISGLPMSLRTSGNFTTT
jgi:hypothetical protein